MGTQAHALTGSLRTAAGSPGRVDMVVGEGGRSRPLRPQAARRGLTHLSAGVWVSVSPEDSSELLPVATCCVFWSQTRLWHHRPVAGTFSGARESLVCCGSEWGEASAGL